MARHSRPLGALTCVAVGSLLLALGLAAPASADDYPSWDAVQNARQNEATAAAEADTIEGYLIALELKAADLGRAAQVKGEAYNVARQALDAATAKAGKLDAQATRAAAQAAESARRAGQLVAQFARTGGGNLSLGLLSSADPANLLAQLGTIGKLTEKTAEIYRQATVDEKLARSLADQAKIAAATRLSLANQAQQSLDEANAASAAMLAQVAAQQAAADQLYAQLATLKGTTADIERQYIAGQTDSQQPTQPGQPSQPSQPGTPVSPGTPPVTPTDPTPVTPPTTPVDPTPPPPAPSAVEAAIAFAYAHLGDSYVYGGYGPHSWDCSGLTKAAYAAAGVYIGAHGSTSQYNYLAGQGRLIPLGQLQRGDLVFYSDDGGASTYHTALYIGGGQMIEAQYEGVPVKVSNLRYYDLMSYGARPTG